MGGNVGVIIKKEDGEQIGMSRWTNVMPYHFKNIDLYLGNTQNWFKEFAKEWLLMQEDYEANKETGKYEHNMTDVYFPHGVCGPDEYGIIAVDFKGKKVYSSQDYCNIGSLALYNIWDRYQENNENIEMLQKYYDNGFLKEFLYYCDDNPKEKQIIDISKLKFKEIIQFLEEANERDVKTFSHDLFKNINKKEFSVYSSLFLFNTDWKFFTHHDRAIGILKVKMEMEKDGFIFTEKDNNAWKDYLSYRWSGHNEEELKENETYQEFKILYKEVFKESFILKKE